MRKPQLDVEGKILVCFEEAAREEEIINELDSKFPEAIRKQSFSLTEIQHKVRWLPVLE